MRVEVSPSLLAADFSRLAEQIRWVEQAGADRLHLDVMDGHFVPNITFGPGLVASIRPTTKLLLEAHLMITRPLDFLEAFAKAGADLIIVHAEAASDLPATLAAIRSLGLKAGLSIKPNTPLEAATAHAENLDLILFMTVEPGFGGQAFMPQVLPKLKAGRRWMEERGLRLDFEVDGGIGPATAGLAVEAGANVLVAGTAVFGQPDPAAVIAALKQAGQPR